MSDDNVVHEFLVESYENLDRLDQDFVSLEQNPQDRDRLSSIFRTIHTIKGTCGFLGFSKLERVAHVGENLLSRLRDGKLDLNPEITSSLLTMVDAVRQILSCIESDGNEGDADYTALITDLTRLQEAAPVVESATPPKSSPLSPTPVTNLNRVGAADGAPVPPRNPPTDASKPPAVEGLEAVAAAPVASEAPPSPPDPPTAPTGSDGGGGSRPPAGRPISESTIRVDVRLLDTLMNLVGELVLARNQILQYAARNEDSTLGATSQRLNLITTELQEGVMKTRMQPIGNVWSKFPRVVRDLAMACQKNVRIEMEGKETELDKTIIEAIKDPLTHLVRNSVDHGIETPDIRKANGKPDHGILLLRAYHEGGQVNIEITDDGGGIDPAKLKAKAVEKGVITQDHAARMGDREALGLIFAAGFSTAAKVTNVSGRGVGMDVVRTNIEKIGGTVDVQSKLGQGTTLKIKIPLTLAIVPALIITVKGHRYAIPQVSLLELVRLDGEGQGIEHIEGTPVYRLRGNLLPIVHLAQELGLDTPAPVDTDEDAATDGKAVNIVVLQADERQFGLVVDEINDTEEIVVKPLGQQLKGIDAFAGATIMGDGRVALILDVMGVAQKGRVVSEIKEHGHGEKDPAALRQGADRRTLLLVRLGESGRVAIPLEKVARLEEFPRDSVEKGGNREVVQYRDRILRLVRVADVLGMSSFGTSEAEEPLQVVVYTHGEESIGLVVDAILDIVEEEVDLGSARAEAAGIMGAAIIQEKVTDLLDVEDVIRSVDPMFFEPRMVA